MFLLGKLLKIKSLKGSLTCHKPPVTTGFAEGFRNAVRVSRRATI
jgi:hypothetical protein